MPKNGRRPCEPGAGLLKTDPGSQAPLRADDHPIDFPANAVTGLERGPKALWLESKQA